ncbi:hypothetical protein PROFUN_02192 [Planoprotostelium fungivorum]|uniref:Uncharacterized protein n=1 Tax=Planoprotostelium fungivorum TaxID=1890364 RepID=A0A2P6NZH1_9EUKA|nr:hypothetical protein PROFUN_02192 [Planoprotostelium fungivorum]
MSNTHTWFEETLKQLLESPYIHFPKPPPGLHLGHGPVDLFSTRFNNNFRGTVGMVNGTEVDHDGLKAVLLALQSHYDRNSQFTSSQGERNTVVSEISLPDGPLKVEAMINEAKTIELVKFEGPESLFVKKEQPGQE